MPGINAEAIYSLIKGLRDQEDSPYIRDIWNYVYIIKFLILQIS